jgi:protein-S-isoprenylcysteine O-methyltransferase
MIKQKDNSFDLIWGDRGYLSSVLIAFSLGITFGIGTGLIFLSKTWIDFGIYMIFLSFFHLWEYVYVALFHIGELTIHSFLIDHSKEYGIAFITGMLEYFIERLLFPNMKGSFLFMFIGFLLLLVGQSIRVTAMYTAGSNFHHLVREQKEKDHKLITTGIYYYLRHPSYFGWFWWAIGTQIVLTNIISIFLYSFAAWKFFEKRIKKEEKNLIKFFGDDYERYRSKTPIGIPFIK